MPLEVRCPPGFRWDREVTDCLYALTRQEQDRDTIWLWEGNPPLSAEQFAGYFLLPGVVLFLPIFDNQILGMTWVDHIVPGHKAYGHMFFFAHARRRRDLNLREIATTCAQSIGRVFDLKHLYFYLASKHLVLVNFARNAGVEFTGILPGYFRHGEEYSDAIVGHMMLGATDA